MTHREFIKLLKAFLKQHSTSKWAESFGLCYSFNLFLGNPNGLNHGASSRLKNLLEEAYGNRVLPFNIEPGDPCYLDEGSKCEMMQNPKRLQFIAEVLAGKYDKKGWKKDAPISTQKDTEALQPNF